jgi:hypothetical protein
MVKWGTQSCKPFAMKSIKLTRERVEALSYSGGAGLNFGPGHRPD